MKVWLIIVGVLAASCSPAESSGAEDNQAAESNAWLEAKLKTDRCQRKEGERWVSIPWRDCLKFGSPERIQGVWYAVYEQQGFVEAPRKAPMLIANDANAAEFETWLDLDTAAAMKMAGQPAWAACIRAVAVDFIGRRPAERLADHVAAPKNLIVVDKLISARFLGQVRLKGVSEKEQDCSRKAEEVEP